MNLIVTVNSKDLDAWKAFLKQSSFQEDSILDERHFYFSVLDQDDADSLEMAINEELNEAGCIFPVSFEGEE